MSAAAFIVAQAAESADNASKSAIAAAAACKSDTMKLTANAKSKRSPFRFQCSGIEVEGVKNSTILADMANIIEELIREQKLNKFTRMIFDTIAYIQLTWTSLSAES